MSPERAAAVVLSRVFEPGSDAVHAAVTSLGSVEVLERLRGDGAVPPLSARRLAGARERLSAIDPTTDLRRAERCGARLVLPGDEEWPEDRLTWAPGTLRTDEAPPLWLWVRGTGELAPTVERSVAVVGARAASSYGTSVAGELALGLADRGWTVVSGGAYGVDGAAHRGSLAGGGPTVALLACGVDVSYPRGHDRLLGEVAAAGLVVSEVPPGAMPTRVRFLVRNRLIAALSAGTVVVEAAIRSGSLSTARIAGDLGRPLMAVPGPVTSVLSTGCHDLLRRGATCVASAVDVLVDVGRPGEWDEETRSAPVDPRDGLSAVVRQVLDAVPVRAAAGIASIARTAGVSALVVQQVLPPLVVTGLVEQRPEGWRLTALGAGR